MGIMPPAPLAYEGDVSVPWINRQVAPLPTNNAFNVPTLWTNTAAGNAYLLTRKPGGVATWAFLGGPTSGLRDVGRYVVSTMPGQTQYTSIQAAINQAVLDGASQAAPVTIWIWPGKYTENLTLAPFVALEAESPGITGCIIEGNAVFTAGTSMDYFLAMGVTFKTPVGGGVALSLQGTQQSFVYLKNVNMMGTTGTAFQVNNTQMIVRVYDTVIESAAGFKCIDVVLCNQIMMFDAIIQSTDTPSTLAGPGQLIFLQGFCHDSFVVSDFALLVGDGAVFESLGTTSVATLAVTSSCLMLNAFIICQAASGFWATGTGFLLYSAVTAVLGSANVIDPVLNRFGAPLNVGNLTFDGGLTSITTDGQLIIGKTGAVPQIGNLTGSGGITITNGPGTINISGTGGGFTWSDQPANFAAAPSMGYFCSAALTATLPVAPVTGDTISFVATVLGVVVQANGGQTIQVGNTASSVAGTATNLLAGDSFTLTFHSPSSTWWAYATQGNWSMS